MNNLKDSIELLKLYFRNKASQGAVTLNDRCVLTAFEDVVNKRPTARIYQNQHGHYMIGVLCPVFNTRQDAEKWAIDNGYRINTDN